jgi:SsrA-binding protein
MSVAAKSSANRNIAVNRQASYEYSLLERYEAGLVLTGTEIKSVRQGRVSLQGAYAAANDGELWLHNCHIAPYEAGGVWNQEPTRPRKLLLHKDEIRELAEAAETKRLTIVPLRLYTKNGRAKVELALARGKRQYDRREAIAKRDAEREIERSLRRRS